MFDNSQNNEKVNSIARDSASCQSGLCKMCEQHSQCEIS